MSHLLVYASVVQVYVIEFPNEHTREPEPKRWDYKASFINRERSLRK